MIKTVSRTEDVSNRLYREIRRTYLFGFILICHEEKIWESGVFM